MTSAAGHQPGALLGLTSIVVWACERMASFRMTMSRSRGERAGPGENKEFGGDVIGTSLLLQCRRRVQGAGRKGLFDTTLRFTYPRLTLD